MQQRDAGTHVALLPGPRNASHGRRHHCHPGRATTGFEVLPSCSFICPSTAERLRCPDAECPCNRALGPVPPGSRRAVNAVPVGKQGGGASSWWAGRHLQAEAHSLACGLALSRPPEVANDLGGDATRFFRGMPPSVRRAVKGLPERTVPVFDKAQESVVASPTFPHGPRVVVGDGIDTVERGSAARLLDG